jgi:hypothetical protein
MYYFFDVVTQWIIDVVAVQRGARIDEDRASRSHLKKSLWTNHRRKSKRREGGEDQKAQKT